MPNLVAGQDPILSSLQLLEFYVSSYKEASSRSETKRLLRISVVEYKVKKPSFQTRHSYNSPSEKTSKSSHTAGTQSSHF